jgi:Mn2+/Fe2+ NRAMP family transporter
VAVLGTTISPYLFFWQAAQEAEDGIQSSTQAAEALRPVAGPFAFTLFALGIIGTGLLTVPVLAGSAAMPSGTPVSGSRLEPKTGKSQALLYDHCDATMVGIAINFSALNPIKALYWSAVINGVVAVPVMIAMMDMTSNPKIIRPFRIHDGLRFMGWITTAVMAVAPSSCV